LIAAGLVAATTTQGENDMDQPIAPQPASDALGAIAGMHRDVPETDGLWYAS